MCPQHLHMKQKMHFQAKKSHVMETAENIHKQHEKTTTHTKRGKSTHNKGSQKCSAHYMKDILVENAQKSVKMIMDRRN